MTPHTAHSRQIRTQEEPMDTLLEQATPRPWRRGGYPWNAGRLYASLDGPEMSELSAADAELIVQAVNAYEPLVKALRRMIALTNGWDEVIEGSEWFDAITEARAALAIVPESDSGHSVESSPERDGGEHRPAIGLSSAGAHKLCMKCGEPWPCRSVSDR